MSGTVCIVPCRICGHPTENKVRLGAIVCNACKKFFMRNHQRYAEMHCSTGSHACLESQPLFFGTSLTSVRMVRTSAGSTLRLICPRCRLAKCFAVGMHTQTSVSPIRDHSEEITDVASANHVVVNTTPGEYCLLMKFLLYLENPLVSNNKELLRKVHEQLVAVHQFAAFAQEHCTSHDPAVMAVRYERLFSIDSEIQMAIAPSCFETPSATKRT